MRRLVATALFRAIVVAVLLAAIAAPACSQSPAFPNTQPIAPQPLRDFPFYRITGPAAPVFPPEVIIFYVPRAMPSDYPSTRGYGSSPYTRIYGGAGSVAPVQPEPQILMPGR